MKINRKYQGETALRIWETLCEYVEASRGFRSVSGIDYRAEVRHNAIFYKGGCGRRAEAGEYFDRTTFLRAYDSICALPEINTCTVKPFLNRRQTPFIGLLLSAGILV